MDNGEARLAARLEEWVERIVGGRVVGTTRLARWRPAWDVDVERGQMAHTASVRGWGHLPVRPDQGGSHG